MGSYPSVEMQSEYSTAPADWTSNIRVCLFFLFVCLFGGVGRQEYLSHIQIFDNVGRFTVGVFKLIENSLAP